MRNLHWRCTAAVRAALEAGEEVDTGVGCVDEDSGLIWLATTGGRVAAFPLPGTDSVRRRRPRTSFRA